MLWARISTRARCTTLCDNVCQWLATGRWFSPGPPMPPTNKTERHDITEIVLKVAINTIKQTNTCSIRFAMHVYMVVKFLLLTMSTLYEIIVWWIFVVHVWQIVMSTLYFMWNHSLAAFHQFYSFLELSEIPIFFFFKFFSWKEWHFFNSIISRLFIRLAEQMVYFILVCYKLILFATIYKLDKTRLILTHKAWP